MHLKGYKQPKLEKTETVIWQKPCYKAEKRYTASRRKEAKEKTMSIALKQVFNKDKTFRPKRKFEPGTQRFELHKRAQASLNSGVDLKAAVQLPSGEDQNDWVAVHVVDFFNRINLIYGTICEFCTERTCPVMSGGPKYEYRWQDDLKYKKPTALPAPQYMNLLMDWIEVQINNEDIFPTCVARSPSLTIYPEKVCLAEDEDGVPFPKNFLQICKKILCRLFRVFVHVYIHHFDRVIVMGAEAHVNTCYKHFYYFVTEMNLIDRKELEPLDGGVSSVRWESKAKKKNLRISTGQEYSSKCQSRVISENSFSFPDQMSFRNATSSPPLKTHDGQS
ncbi:hypothetical protein E2I00_004641 [Balaenoptera physalus]|uniref:MOB kinase activator 3B n=1 Tax=Balaenoptera physalus TaxID=9770 RepID=A0A6A1QBN8_BALPH|nr:hypothetical protein E2I00_004641 [Balaenoptera physalus]